MKISKKLILGFGILALTIFMVGIGGIIGTNEINKQLHLVSDKSVPQLQGSYDQIVALNQANQSLLKFLSSPASKFQIHLDAFEASYAHFTESLNKLKSEQQDGSELFNALITSEEAAKQYVDSAARLKILHAEKLLAAEEANSSAQLFQAQIDSMSNWGQRYLTKDNSAEAISAMRNLMKTVNRIKLSIRIYEKTKLIDKLKEEFSAQEKQLLTDYANFKKEDQNAQRILGIIDGLRASMNADTGLLGALIKQDANKVTLQKTLDEAENYIAKTEEALQTVLNIAFDQTNKARTNATTAIKASQTLIYALSTIGLIIAATIGYLLTQTIRKPLTQILQKLTLVGQGNMTVSFEDTRKDEFGELAKSLNTVVSGLQLIIEQVVTNTKQLSQVAADNAKISNKTTAAMAEQSRQLEQTSAAATEMEHTVSDVSTHSDSTLTAVQNCEALSRDADQKVSMTRSSIMSQASVLQSAVGASTELEQDSKKIDSILVTINTIAEQTNLLALNAAIEAARAGDHGRGFAVVADEVRQLASRTQNSTEEIQSMVGSMQMRIRSVASSMRDSHDQATECVEHASSSSEALQAIQAAIETIRDMNTHIAEAASQQSTAVQEVSRTLVNINNAATETTEGADAAAHSSSTLLKIAQKQQELVRKFTI